MTKKILVIDDTRNLLFPEEDEVIVARHSQAGLDIMYPNIPHFDEIWLDFDLGGIYGRTELFDTAMPVVLQMAEDAYYGYPYPVDLIIIHTGNPVGRDAMGLTLRRYGYNVRDEYL